jgi:hypothetical protein
MDRKLLKVTSLGTGDIIHDRSGIELGLTLDDGSEARLLIQKDVLERLIYAFQSLMTKLTQLNPKGALVGETVTVTPIEADRSLIGTTDDGKLAIRFESDKGMCPTIVMNTEAGRMLHGFLSEWMKNPNVKSPSHH